jgi:hypothetical protein
LLMSGEEETGVPGAHSFAGCTNEWETVES